MPLVAKNKLDGNRIDITKLDNPRTSLKSVDIVCPYCDIPMFVRQCSNKINHFVHKSICTSDYERKPESIAHIMAKQFLADKLRTAISEISDAKVEIEYPFKEIKRIADVAIIFPMGWIEVHEIQLSPITINTFEERTNDYFKTCADVKWWLGEKLLNSKTITDWIRENFEELLILDIEITEEQSSYFDERI